jgi:signal peptidase I
MRQLVGVIGTALAPGFGQALVERHRRAAFWLACFALSVLATWWTVWAVPLLFVVYLACIGDAFLVLRAERARPRADWLAAFIAVGAFIALLITARMFLLEAFKAPASSMYPTLWIGDHFYADKLGPRLRGVARGEVIVFTHPCMPDREYVKRVIAMPGETVEIRCDVVYVDGKPVANQLVSADCSYDDFEEGSGQWYARQCSEYAETSGEHTYHVFHDVDRPERDRAPTSSARDFPRLDAEAPPSSAMSGDPFLASTATAPRQQPGTLVETRPGAAACEPQRHYVVPEGHIFTLGDNRPNSNDSRYWGVVPLDHVIGRVYGIWYPGRGAWGRFGGID